MACHRVCTRIAAAAIVAALLAAGPEAAAQVLLSDTFDRANGTNLGNFNNALGGTLTSGSYVEVVPGLGHTDRDQASINANRLEIFGFDVGTNVSGSSSPGKVTPSAALGTANFSITARASSSLVNPTAGGTYVNTWLMQLRAPSTTSNAADTSSMNGQVDLMMAPNGQLFIRSWSGGVSTVLNSTNPFTGGTTANMAAGTPGALPTAINGFAFDTDGDGNIDGSESFLLGATINGSTLNVLINGSSVASMTVPVAAPATNYAALAKQRWSSANTIVTGSFFYDNLVIASATTNSSLAGSAVNGFRVLQGSNATTTFWLSNSGSHATAFSLGLANATALAVSGSTVGTVAASGSTAITVGYANTATTGVRSGTVSIANLGTLSDMPAAVTVSGEVLAAASLTRVQSGAVGSGGEVSLTNAAGPFRAAGSIASQSLTGDGGWSVAGLAQGGAIAAGATAGGTASFDSTGKLNGTYLGTFTLGLQNDQSIQGATAGDLGTMNWNLSQTVSGNLGGGSAALAAGRSLSGFSGQRDGGLSTVATLLDGETTGATTVTMAFANKPVGSYFSDVLELHGTDGLAQVLQLSFDPGSLAGTAENSLVLGWKNGSNEWVNAVLGNTGSNPGFTGTAFLGSWADYLAAGSGRTAANSLGAYGVDTNTNTVWAAINHNSEFVVIVPEPGAIALAGIGIAAAAWATRRRRLEARSAS